MPDRKLRVFLCHASQDKPIVRELYQRLLTEGWIDPWLDEAKLLPGMDWGLEIEKAVESADAAIVCLSNNSVSKEGHIQKEFVKVLDVAREKPEGTLFVIPIRLDNCSIPRSVKLVEYADYFGVDRDGNYETILDSLRRRREQKEFLEAKKNINKQGSARDIGIFVGSLTLSKLVLTGLIVGFVFSCLELIVIGIFVLSSPKNVIVCFPVIFCGSFLSGLISGYLLLLRSSTLLSAKSKQKIGAIVGAIAGILSSLLFLIPVFASLLYTPPFSYSDVLIIILQLPTIGVSSLGGWISSRILLSRQKAYD